METVYSDYLLIEEVGNISGLFTPEELRELREDFEEISSIYERLIPSFIKTYLDETNIKDDYLNPKLRSKLANEFNRSEEELEREGLDFFQAELPNIKRAIKKADSKKQWSSIIDICDSLITFYNVRTYWEDLEETLQTALTAAKKDKNKVAEARIYNNIAHTSRLLGRAKEGIDYGLNSYDIFCSLKNTEGKAESSYTLGYLYRSLGEWEDSIKYFENCLSLFKQLEDFVGEAGALDGLGQVYTKQENLDEAEKVLEESLRIKEEKVGDRFQISITLNNLGKVYKIKGNLEKAKNLFERSLKIKQQIEDRQGQGVSYNELGVIYRLMKDYKQALEYFEKSLDIKKEVSSSGTGKATDNHGEGLTFMEIGTLYEETDKHEKALINWKNALEKLNNYSPEFTRVTNYIKSLEAQMQQKATRKSYN
ncbi:MAG: tetratricopeptide repeat protein [Okeania sp. SIO3B5]|uniref:tetratricopeptide repeat protein n=1 Tax=Okeania sp. SIO3B5 TaxID=2607811 RepID=UPI00140133D2|nr:tetratricopeptide repeat protein [Okeania sp. SIO3B5]NEO51773.1 tetratricopeptide repeat protein [Okeania sp. SIO3B5]